MGEKRYGFTSGRPVSHGICASITDPPPICIAVNAEAPRRRRLTSLTFQFIREFSVSSLSIPNRSTSSS
ncbi:hypothetical protein PS2_007051 [Malus domestica]